MSSTFSIIGAMLLAMGVVGLILNVNNNMQMESMETVASEQLQGSVELQRSILRDEFRNIGRDISSSDDVFSSSSGPYDLTYYTVQDSLLTMVKLFLTTDEFGSANDTWRLMRQKIVIDRRSGYYYSPSEPEQLIPNIVEFKFRYFDSPTAETASPSNDTRFIEVNWQIVSDEEIADKSFSSAGSERVLLRQLLYRS